MISILLPFKDAEGTLLACLSSILAQSYPHFEIIAVDDHSSDDSANLVRQYPDCRIRSVKNQGNGLIPALNCGLSVCQYPYVARMDADDLMRPNRLATQLAHFRRIPELTLSGSRVSLFSKTPLRAGYIEYISWQNAVLCHTDIRNQIYVESPFAHPSVMFKKDAVLNVGGYEEGDFPEDYDLWLKLFSAGHQMEKLSQTLLDWREAPIRESRTNPRYRREAFDRLRARYLSRDNRIIPSNRPISIWGAGRKTRLRARWLLDLGIRLSNWIDIDPKKIGNVINGIQVISPQSLNNLKEKPFVLIYVTNHGARDDISSYLDSIGYCGGKDYLAVG